MSTKSFQYELVEIKKQVDTYLKEFMEKKIKRVSHTHPLLKKPVEDILDMTMRGGDRLRPVLCLWGYEASGGKERKRMLPVACALEMFHTFALIHDDVMDKGETRRGRETIHVKIAKEFSHLPKEKAAHYGLSGAILAGDLAYAYADELFASTSEDHLAHQKALELFTLMKQEVIYGQYLDVFGGASGVDEDEILTIYEYKTARYSIEKPLLIGCVLGGRDKSVYDALSLFGKCVGVAFQIRDDLLGIFGDEILTGKSGAGDMHEGKYTLLMVKTLEMLKKNGNTASLKKINTLFGNKQSSLDDVLWLKECMSDSGARLYCEKKAQSLVDGARVVLGKATINPRIKANLLELADFAIHRLV